LTVHARQCVAHVAARILLDKHVNRMLSPVGDRRGLPGSLQIASISCVLDDRAYWNRAVLDFILRERPRAARW
jgi:hypothetical protein